jgi:hypothetical protein
MRDLGQRLGSLVIFDKAANFLIRHLAPSILGQKRHERGKLIAEYAMVGMEPIQMDGAAKFYAQLLVKERIMLAVRKP